MKSITRTLLGLLLTTAIACNSAPQQEAEAPTTDSSTNSVVDADRRSEFEKAEEKYFEALAKDPDGLRINYALGVLYYNEGVTQLEETDSAKYQAIVNDPHLYDMPLEVLFPKLQIDDIEGKTFVLFNRAIKHFERGYAADSTYPDLLQGLAGCYFIQGQVEKAAYFKKRADEELEKRAAAKAEETEVAEEAETAE